MLKNENLLEKIQAHVIGYADADLLFAQRLGRDNGWSESYAKRVETEYKRFVYLAMTLGHPVTPSDQVDQAWHLHLSYTRDYWDVFCPRVLGMPLHHNPTRGGGSEQTKFSDWYAQTLAGYTTVFGEPPQDIWPASEKRFSQRFQRRPLEHSISKQSNHIWIVSILGALGLIGVAWGAEETSHFNFGWLTLLGLFAVLVIGFWVKSAISNKKGNGNGCGGGCGGGGGGHSGCGGGGCGGCGG